MRDTSSDIAASWQTHSYVSRYRPQSSRFRLYPRNIRATVPGFLIVLLLMFSLLGLAACGSAAATPCHPSGTATGTWPEANGDYANTRDAATSLLASHNVKALCVAWTFQVSGIAASGALATSPIVQSGIVYLQDLQSNMYAINLTGGTLKWEHHYNAYNGGPNGVAAEGGHGVRGEQHANHRRP